MNSFLKLFAAVFFFSFLFLIFPPKAHARYLCDDGTIDCYGPTCQSTGYSWSDIPMSNCTSQGINPPPNTCNATGNWDFSYYVCQIHADPATNGCSYQTAAHNFTCSAADACEGSTGGGGTGYSANGHVVAGHCSPGTYVEGNPGSACTSGGYYKQCCSAGGNSPATYCSGGACPAGSITTAFDTTCDNPLPPTATPTPLPLCPGTCGPASQDQTSCGANGAYWSWDAKGPGTSRNCINPNSYCYSCVTPASATPTPTPVTSFCPNANPDGSTNRCSTGPGCFSSEVHTAGGDVACTDFKGSTSWCCNTPLPGTTPPPTATPAPPGGTCDTTALQLCGTCQKPPAQNCGQCGVSNYCGYCTDNNSLCSGGLVCSGGSCVTPTYTLSGTVFNDLNVNGTRDAGCYVDFNGNNTPDGDTTYPGVSEPTYTLSNSTCRDFANGTPKGPFNFDVCKERTTGTYYLDDRCTGGDTRVAGRSGSFKLTPGSDTVFTGSGATVTISGSGGGTVSVTSGKYAKSGLAGSHSVTLNQPAGYYVTSANPDLVTLSSNTIHDFGIAPLVAPTCGGLTANPGVIPAGGSSTLSLINCIPTAPTPTYAWTPPTTGTIPGCTGPTCTYFAPPTVCSTTTVPISATVTNPAGSTIVNGSVTVTPRTPVTGTVYIDSGNNNCSSGTTTVAGIALTDYAGGVPSGNTTTTASGAYTLNDTAACGARSMVISSGTNVPATVRFNGGSYTNVGLTGYTYGPFTLNGATTLDWCLTPAKPWYQTNGGGDVRFNQLVDSLPPGQSVALGTAGNTGVLFSSKSNPILGGGTASPTTPYWVVSKEFDYNADSNSLLGDMSYSFYVSRLSQFNIKPVALPGCPKNADNTPAAGNCTLDLNGAGLTTNVYQVLGSLTLQNSYTVPNGNHIIILVQGTVNIGFGTNTNISAPAGNKDLFVLASKGIMTIDPSVGSPVNTTTPNLSGYYTSESSIMIQGNASCNSGVSDSRLNVEGSLIANSLHPFASAGSGSVVNGRSLCTNDGSFPSYYVKFRPDFLTQFTDFYKSTLKTLREVAP